MKYLLSFIGVSLLKLIPSAIFSYCLTLVFDSVFSLTSQQFDLFLIVLTFVITLTSSHLSICSDAAFSLQKLNEKELQLNLREEAISTNERASEERLKSIALRDKETIREQSAKEAARLDEIRSRILHIRDASLQDAPWLSSFYADFLYTSDVDKAKYLQRKSRPAQKAADAVKQLASEKREALKQLKLLQYQMAVYESIAPWLEDFKEVDTETIQNCLKHSDDNSIQNDYDTVKRWLSKNEYDVLTTAEKYQLALDRYNKSRKTRWEIGRDYERYIGYLYESSGNKVEYFGATQGLEDMGRDLIVHFKMDTGEIAPIVIQCKYWNEHRTVHEKHIFQLYGSMIMYRIEHNVQKVGCMFFSTAPLSDTAKKAADMLNIGVSIMPFEKTYPCIKCNINSSSGDRIYHLPFDQQYDRVRINPDQGEAYVYTVAEAEAQGFRRAMRWKGSLNNQ